jgi:tRNA pseudouridine38-40 synthase
MTATLRLDVQYDGTDFHGWQRMPGVPTLQGALEEALSTVLRKPVEINAAGRTDAGVHAHGQVCTFLWDEPLDEEKLRRLLRGVNALTPDGIAVRSIRNVPDRFHARFSAVGKRYIYRIHNGVAPPVFEPRFLWHVPHPLNVDAMQQAAWCLLGEHDFNAFRASGCQAQHAHRYIWRARVFRDGGEGVTVELWGNAFVRSQVRITVGTLVEIGQGRRAAQDMRRILETLDRTQAGKTAPPQGLSLHRVFYPDDAAEAGIPPGARWPGWPPDDAEAPGLPPRAPPP